MLKEEALSMNELLLLLLKLNQPHRECLHLIHKLLKSNHFRGRRLEGDEADAEALGAKAITGAYRRLHWP